MQLLGCFLQRHTLRPLEIGTGLSLLNLDRGPTKIISIFSDFTCILYILLIVNSLWQAYWCTKYTVTAAGCIGWKNYRKFGNGLEMFGSLSIAHVIYTKSADSRPTAASYVIFIPFLTCVSHTAHVIDIGWTSVCPSVRPSVRHTLVLCRNGSTSSNGLHCLVAPWF